MLVKLKLLRGSHAGKEIPIKKTSFTIGRAEECSLRVNSEAISRKHCEILVCESGVTVEDFDSKNGTFINGVKTEGAQPLAMGDQLRVGVSRSLQSLVVNGLVALLDEPVHQAWVRVTP